VVPRHTSSIPSIEVKPPNIPERPKLATLPFSSRSDTASGTSTLSSDTDQLSPVLNQPNLLTKLSADQDSAKPKRQERQRKLASEGYFFLTGTLAEVGWAKIYLYDHGGGFFNPNDSDPEMNLLGTVHLDSDGDFRIGPIRYKTRWFYRGKDVVLVLELDSPYAVAYSEIYGTVKPFRFLIAERSRITPEGGEYDMGTIEINLESDEYYPVRVFDRIVRRLREEKRVTDQKVRIEFVHDVERPKFMEEIGYILMPYRNGQPDE